MKALPLDTEDAAKLAVQKIQAEKERLQYFEDTEHTQLAVDTVKNFDIAYRTVDGYLHQTREDADFSRSEINQILAVEESVDFSDIDSVANGQQQLSVFHSAVARSTSRSWTRHGPDWISSGVLLRQGFQTGSRSSLKLQSSPHKHSRSPTNYGSG